MTDDWMWDGDAISVVLWRAAGAGIKKSLHGGPSGARAWEGIVEKALVRLRLWSQSGDNTGKGGGGGGSEGTGKQWGSWECAQILVRDGHRSTRAAGDGRGLWGSRARMEMQAWAGAGLREARTEEVGQRRGRGTSLGAGGRGARWFVCAVRRDSLCLAFRLLVSPVSPHSIPFPPPHPSLLPPLVFPVLASCVLFLGWSTVSIARFRAGRLVWCGWAGFVLKGVPRGFRG